MSNFKAVRRVNFEFNNVLTWGVVSSRVGYTIPISVGRDALLSLNNISESYHTKSPVYGRYNTIYLKVDTLTFKQESELLNKGRLRVSVDMEVTGVNTTASGIRYLSLRVTRLQKVVRVVEDQVL